MWVWKRLVKVKWTDKKSNAEVLNLVKENKSLLAEIRKTKRRWIGHILRHENTLRNVLEGRMKGKRPRGRKRIEMVDDTMTGTYAQMKRRAEDREEWRRDVMRDLSRKADYLDGDQRIAHVATNNGLFFLARGNSSAPVATNNVLSFLHRATTMHPLQQTTCCFFSCRGQQTCLSAVN